MKSFQTFATLNSAAEKQLFFAERYFSTMQENMQGKNTKKVPPAIFY